MVRMAPAVSAELRAGAQIRNAMEPAHRQSPASNKGMPGLRGTAIKVGMRKIAAADSGAALTVLVPVVSAVKRYQAPVQIRRLDCVQFRYLSSALGGGEML